MEKRKVRTNIYLTPWQHDVLEKVSRRTGSSAAELVRQAIDAVYSKEFAREADSLEYKRKRRDQQATEDFTLAQGVVNNIRLADYLDQTREAQARAENADEKIFR